MLPVSLDCPYLIAPLVFSNVYLSISVILFRVIENAGAHEWQAVLHLKLTQSPLISRLNAGQVLMNGKQFST
jgi:hypothetical protein